LSDRCLKGDVGLRWPWSGLDGAIGAQVGVMGSGGAGALG
jgi:hypothetical protein